MVLLTVRQAAARLGFSELTVRRLMREGQLPALRPTGARAVRVADVDVDGFVKRLRRSAGRTGTAA